MTGGQAQSTLAVDFPHCVRTAFPAEFDVAWNAVTDVLHGLKDRDLSPLARHSPGLAGYDWTAYLTCSVVRMTRVLRALEMRAAGGRVLDCGAYFGNFSLMLARAGYRVDAADSYARYAPAFDRTVEMLTGAGVTVVEADAALQAQSAGRYDAVLAMGVIEHVPHTPRLFLSALNATIKPGGWLLLDTPNLAYLYTRQRLARGESVFTPLTAQWNTALPFEGHHREYTTAEVRWMLEQIGHVSIDIETFNYSYLALTVLQGDDLDNHQKMQADPGMREVIFSVSRKPQ